MSVEKAGKRWRVRWREGGRNRSRTFDRKGDARDFDADLRIRRQRGPLAVLDAGRTTLREYVEATWWPHHRLSLAPSTRKFYDALWTVHIEPYLGDVPLRDLSSARIRDWQAALNARKPKPVGRNKLNRALGMLGTILRRAVEDEEIETNPVARVRRLPAKRRPKVVPPSPKTIERIRAELGEQDAVAVAVLAYAGLRPGEAFALRWRNVRDGEILVEDATDGSGGIKGTKTNSVRRVRLLPPLAADLRAWRLRSAASGPDDLVLPGPSGKVVDGPRYVDWSARWRRACKKAEVSPAPRPYDLRHGFASLLLAEGRTVHSVAAQLGHDPALTLSVYGHVMPDLENSEGPPTVSAVEEIEAARGGSGTSSVPSAPLVAVGS